MTSERVSAELCEIFREERPYAGEIAFFGGSFTCLPGEEMTAYLRAAAPFVEKGLAAGIRCSTRPDGISEEILVLYKSFGGTSVELGVQSMDDEVLSKNGRGYTAKTVERAAELIRAAGLSLGVQMMAGLPGEGADGALRTAEKLIALKPDTVRIYPALVLKNTDMERWFRAGEYTPLTLSEAVERCAPLLKLFENAGVRVIRMGLHAERSLEESLVAGPYHPAFRELCEAKLFRDGADALLKMLPQGSYILTVSPKDRSRAAGQKRQNLLHWQESGYEVRIEEDSALKKGEAFLSTPTERKRLCF